MALDFDDNMRTAATAVDVSAATTVTHSPVDTTFNRIAFPNFPRGLYLVGIVSVASAAADMVQFRAAFEYTTDAGVTFQRAAQIEFQADANGIPTQRRQAAIGLLDIVPEQEAADQIRWRVVLEWDASVSASDPTLEFYLAGDQGIEAIKDAE